MQHKPEVLSEMRDISAPDYTDGESIKIFLRKIDTRSKMIAEMSDSIIPMDFHMYRLRIGGGSLEMQIDYSWNIFGISYSGNAKEIKQFEKISKEMYIYYGVSKDDVKNKTERYMSLVAALC